MGDALSSFWGVSSASLVGKKGNVGLAWFICGQKVQESLESSPLMHLLDGLEGKEYNCFRR